MNPGGSGRNSGKGEKWLLIGTIEHIIPRIQLYKKAFPLTKFFSNAKRSGDWRQINLRIAARSILLVPHWSP